MKRIIVIIFFVTFANILICREMIMLNMTFYDEDRDNREIPTVIFLPSTISFESRNVAKFPFAVFGHAWLLNYNSYQNLTDFMVSEGWLIAYPRTEEGFFPNHSEFALDLVFLNSAIYSEGENPESPLYGLIKPLSVLMGHSMGGGASVLAASSIDNNYDSLVTFAAADTNPSAIAAAENVFIPSITFSAPGDNITPPNNHQIPIYDNLSSVYKSFVSLPGETHLGITSNEDAFYVLSYWLDFFRLNSTLEGFELALESLSGVLNFQIDSSAFSLIAKPSPPGAGILYLDQEVFLTPFFFEEGEELFLSALPSQGFAFYSWYNDQDIISCNADFAMEMPAEHTILICDFHMLGDLDRDNLVTQSDALILLEYIVGFDPVPEIDPAPWSDLSHLIADVDGNNLLQALDASYILRYEAGLIEHFPVENGDRTKQGKPQMIISQNGEVLEILTEGEVYGFYLEIPSDFTDCVASPVNVNPDWIIVKNCEENQYKVAGAITENDDDPVKIFSIPLKCSGFDYIEIVTQINDFKEKIIVINLLGNIGLPCELKKPELVANFPNPFNPHTEIAFIINEPGNVKIDIFNTKGGLEKVLLNEHLTPGNYSKLWNGRNRQGKEVSSGVYFYRLITEGFTSTRKMVLLR